MFKRLFWLMVGTGFGFGMSFWVMRVVRQTAARYAPRRLSAQVSETLERLEADLRAALAEGRSAMRQREAELRAEVVATRR